MNSTSHGRLVDRLARMASEASRRVVGLSSGTSYDGIDAALVRVSGSGCDVRVDVERFECVPFEKGMRDRIGASPAADVAELARLHFDLGEAFADAALSLIGGANLAPDEIDLVGSHGQTVYHEPPSGSRRGVTLQIGEADVIAARTGVPTVSDFRTADVAAGGAGAPLIPMVDWLLFREPGRPRLMLNVGGIANVTWVGDELDGLVAFDTGPGNALLDELVRTATAGRDSFDEGGLAAQSGKVSGEAVRLFMEHPYFDLPPPKSTGKELFGPAAARRLARMVHGEKAIESLTETELGSLLATAAMVTARAVLDAAARFTSDVAEVVVSGGGVRNAAIMADLSALFSPVPVVSLAKLGMDPDAKEAVGFAVLANETVAGRAGNVPAATGASRPVVLGKISPAL